MALVDIAAGVSTANVDALVVSACVQMPSLAAIPVVESRVGVPVVSAAVCTAFRMLESLGLPTLSPKAGALLSGRYASGNDDPGLRVA